MQDRALTVLHTTNPEFGGRLLIRRTDAFCSACTTIFLFERKYTQYASGGVNDAA
jgi:hypothetical protein